MDILRKLVVLLLFTSAAANATPNVSPWGHVTFLGGGWGGADLRVQMDIALYNPESCSWTDGYLTSSADGGHDLFASLLVTAYTLRHQVQVVVDGCYLNRPHVIGVYVKP